MITYIPRENEIEYKVSEGDNENIKAVSRALFEAGFKESSKRYFVRASGGDPYFVIAKPYAKENENEPDTMNMWIDVSYEFTVTAQYYYHTHFDNAKKAVDVVLDFYNEKLAEYVIITPNFNIAYADEAKPNWKDAMKLFAEKLPIVVPVFQQMLPSIPENSHHCHSYRYNQGFPLNDIVIGKENNQPIVGREIYQVSVIFGKQAEYYFQN
ncbi:MAG: hypothetical protein IJA82_06735 [Clostridia bacterium]|nr:hypothetical protein [Clostridia bacterium]